MTFLKSSLYRNLGVSLIVLPHEHNKGKKVLLTEYFFNSLYGLNKPVDPNIRYRRTRVPVTRLGDKTI